MSPPLTHIQRFLRLYFAAVLGICCALGAGAQATGAGPGDSSTPRPVARSAGLRAEPITEPDSSISNWIQRGRTDGDVAFEMLALPPVDRDRSPEIVVLVEIDGPSLVKAVLGSTARVELYAHAFARDGQAHRLEESFTVDLKTQRDAVWQGGLKYQARMSLPAGSYDLHVLLKCLGSAAPTIRVQHFVIDDDTGQKPRVVAAVPPPPGRDVWLPVAGRGWRESPFVVEDRPVSPLARPVLVAGRRARAQVFAHRLPAGERGRVELVRSSSVIAGAALAIRDRAPSTGTDVESLAVGFEVPLVPPGEYGLRVSFSNGVRSPVVPVLMMPSKTRARRLLWADLRGNVPSASATTRSGRSRADAAESPTDERARRVGELKGSYADALALLAQGDGSAARAAVLDLESGVLLAGTFEDLQAAQKGVAELLAASDVESLLPVLLLHDDLYMTYRHRKLFALGTHSRTMIETLAELYGRRGGTEGSRVVAARALASLAGRLQEANLPSNSRRLYRRAIDFDPQNRVALLGLAISHERYGEYSLALGFLETLVASHPAFGEGMLRLAVNLERIGVRQRSQELLARVRQSESPDWVRSLAAQESARMLVEDDKLDEAAILLERSLEELSKRDLGSVYLLTHIYDRRREAYRALELVKNLPASANGASPRKTYDSWPEAELEEIRGELTQAATVRASLVARALGRPGTTEGS